MILLIRVVDLGFRRCRRRTEEFSDLMYDPVLILIWKWEPDDSPIRLSFQNQNDNRMSMSSGCHFQIKWIFFKWQPDGVSSDCHFILKWQPDDILIRLSFFLKYEPDGGAIRFLFFYPYKPDRVNCGIKIWY